MTTTKKCKPLCCVCFHSFIVEAGSPELTLLPRTYYSNGSVLFEVKVNGGTPKEDKVSWTLDLTSLDLSQTLQPGRMDGALRPQVRQRLDMRERLWLLGVKEVSTSFWDCHQNRRPRLYPQSQDTFRTNNETSNTCISLKIIVINQPCKKFVLVLSHQSRRAEFII